MRVLSLHFNAAPVEVREKFVVHDRMQLLQACEAVTGIDEVAVLSTCNRVELYFAGTAPTERIAAQWGHECGVDAALMQSYVVEQGATDAIEHLIKVCAGVDSMVLGEPQIFGQVKEAYASAADAGTLGRTLRFVFERAFAAAKKIRNDTGVGERAVNISFFAVKLADQIFDDLASNNVMVLGAGEMAELAVRHFKERGARKIQIWNRTFERARDLARDLGVSALSSDAQYAGLVDSDIVLVSTGASDYIVTSEQIRAVQKARRRKPLLLLDISVPRNVDPAARKEDNVYVYDLDQLQAICEENVGKREQAGVAARELAREAAQRIKQNLSDRLSGPQLGEIYASWQVVAASEIARSAKTNTWTDEQREQVDAMVQAYTRKILHPLQEQVRCGDIDREQFGDLVDALLGPSNDNDGVQSA